MSARHNNVDIGLRVSDVEQLDVWGLNSVNRACTIWLRERGLMADIRMTNDRQWCYRRGAIRKGAQTLAQIAQEIEGNE